MSVRALSTAVSDLVLAGCSFYAALNVCEASIYAACGFTCVALAASFGVLTFGVMFPNIQSQVVRLHMVFTCLASVVGIPLIAAGFCFYHHKPANAKFHLVSSVASCLLSVIHKPLKEKLTLVVSTLAVLGILFVTFMSSNFCATAGALTYGVASAVKSMDFLGFPGVDWFHYILAGANVLLMYGLIR